MTQKEKVLLMRDTIVYLYEKEGRSKSYIAKVLNVDRSVISKAINDWELIKADERHFTPSTQKFLNKNRSIMLDMLDSDATITSIASRLGISRKSLLDTYIQNDKELLHHYNDSKRRKENHTQYLRQSAMDQSRLMYDIEDINGEEWADILGYPGYQVSNMGRVRSWAKRYHRYHLIRPFTNSRTGRVYVTIRNDEKTASLSIPRLVAFAFVTGYDSEHNTVDHIDGDYTNNRFDNLEWVSQGENLRRAYLNGRSKVVGYSKRGKFKKIVLDDKYEFSSIAATARFLNVSDTQITRYLSGECKTDHNFKIVC